MAGTGDRFAVRRLLAAGRSVEALLLRTPFDPGGWAGALAGVSWFESTLRSEVPVVQVAQNGVPPASARHTSAA
jgi:hypothetical protein